VGADHGTRFINKRKEGGIDYIERREARFIGKRKRE